MQKILHWNASQPFSFIAIISSLIPYRKGRERLFSPMKMNAAPRGAAPALASASARDSREALTKNSSSRLCVTATAIGMAGKKSVTFFRGSKLSGSNFQENRQLHHKQTSYPGLFSFFSQFYYVPRSQTPSANV
jgi:hypothetical protein